MDYFTTQATKHKIKVREIIGSIRVRVVIVHTQEPKKTIHATKLADPLSRTKRITILEVTHATELTELKVRKRTKHYCV